MRERSKRKRGKEGGESERERSKGEREKEGKRERSKAERGKGHCVIASLERESLPTQHKFMFTQMPAFIFPFVCQHFFHRNFKKLETKPILKQVYNVFFQEPKKTIESSHVGEWFTDKQFDKFDKNDI